MHDSAIDRLLAQTGPPQGSGLLDLRRRLNRSGPYARVEVPVVSNRSREASSSGLMVQSGCFPPLKAPASITAVEVASLRKLVVVYPHSELGAVADEESVYPFMSEEAAIEYLMQQTGMSRYSAKIAVRQGQIKRSTAGKPGAYWIVHSVLHLPQFKEVPVVS